MSPPLRVVYMGTPDFAVPALQALLESRHEVVGVVTNPDRPSGRGKRLTPPPVKACALAAGVEVFQPPKLRGDDDAFAQIASWAPDVCVVAAYGQILPQRFLDIAPHGCLNIHASLLPKYRGASPINAAIIEGEDESGVTIMRMEAGLDTGPILLQQALPIGPMMTAQELHDRLSGLGGPMIVEALDRLASGDLPETPQDDAGSTYAGLMSKSDGRIDWSADATRVANLIRGVNPWPGAFAFFGDVRLKLHLARPIPADSGKGEPGEVLEASGDGLRIACGEGAIEVLQIQPPGSRAMAPRDFLNGFELRVGDRFS